MKKVLSLFFILLVSKASALFALPVLQDTSLFFGNDTLFTVSQQSIPPNDSGGRWIKTTILLTSCSSWPVHVFGFQLQNPFPGGCNWAPQFFFKPDDSAWFLADSLMLILASYNTQSPVSFGSPWKYKDSLPPPPSSYQNYRYPLLQFVIPPHGTLRIPYWFKAIGPFSFGSHDTVNVSEMFFSTQYPWRGGLDWFSDSVVGTKVFRRIPPYIYSGGPPLYAIAPYSAPYTLSFKGTWTNKNNIALGQYPPWSFGFKDTTMAFQRTRTSFKIVGEYADRFIPPSDTIIWPSCQTGYLPEISSMFIGAPRTVVHDTLVSTFSDDWGTIVTRNPIEAYSVVSYGYKVTHPYYKTITAPFLGSAEDSIILTNLSEFPIQLKDIHLANYGTQKSFAIVSSPNIIAPHDSGMIIVSLLDNDKWRDADDPRRSATVTGTVVPYQTDITMIDSTFSVSLDGIINVYCPYSPHYFYSIPQIKHDTHPAGIVFISDYISNNCVSGRSFVTIFGNNDPISEFFYTPYFDDPSLTINVGDFCRSGSAKLPDLIPPDTANLLPSTNTMQALIEFIGDYNHNYLTKLHWPRGNDTVTMDVLALGASAPPFDDVAPNFLTNNILIWPNPAGSVLHIRTGNKSSSFWISDAIGRIIRRVYTSESEIDISDLSPGLYEISFPALGKSVKFLKS